MTVKENLKTINESLAARTGSSRPTVIAVTKYVTIDRAKEALNAGVTHFGENRVEGFLAKKEALPEGIFHFIGSLQTRKVKDVINSIDYLHSLDRWSLAEEIEKRADHPVKCFVQVNVSGEASKHGMAPEAVVPFVQSLKAFQQIEVVGLMTMAPFSDNEEELRSCFAALRTLKDEVADLKQSNAPCTELSMGMSNDYLIAAEEGATFIRIGTKLVG
ncbi:YggS family pyridoxal phosphate-dependent enzyme [Macrococcus equipercicus]|uniref:Pyridoxal phosphate homeostasis protein n=1 Tax=Macrococcus equipercicus TaxID=69967 RepID=A0A9Q9BQ08_9STAP|nr:YggS family pyridoxal phosphate-dependent enzyme [Macrococcus equipercicus]KAA1042714.1 YggS family pyridoxal phosphate-dependent enzyme [Macrococcus equipercicus]UTH14580.1 YggS family pyridoxal phosphate-dependent enzyme [Macrococcus equipercicus]